MNEFIQNLRDLRMHVVDAYQSYHREWTRPGFHALVLYRIGRWQRTIRSRILGSIIFLILAALYRLVRNVYGIELPYRVDAGRRLHIGPQGGIVIHPGSVFGDDCTIKQNVTIGAVTGADFWNEAPKFGSRVEVGPGAVIIGRIRIGDDVMIAPNSLVMVNVPSNSTVTGNPARVIPMKKGAAREDLDRHIAL
ncbi:MAG TPA: hypothetical protein VIS99_06685 [Terrimicrobiaceae bacterium]